MTSRTNTNLTLALLAFSAGLGLFVGCQTNRAFDPVIPIVKPPQGDALAVRQFAGNALAVIPRRVITYRITNAWNAVSGATGYEIGVGESPGHYSRLTGVGGALSSPITGLLASVTYYIAVRACNQRGTSAWSAEFKWPWPWTNTITVPPGCETTDDLENPQWHPVKTNIFHDLGRMAFFRGKNGQPMTIAITNNVTGYRHRE